MAQVKRINDVTLIELAGEYSSLDEDRFQRVRDLLMDLAQSAEPPLLAIDLSQTKFIGSAFIEVLFRCWKRIEARQGRMALCGLQPFCVEVLQVARMDTLLEMHPSVHDGLAALTAK